MWRTLVLVLAVVACDESSKTKATNPKKQVDKVVDDFDIEEAKQHHASAKTALAAGARPRPTARGSTAS